MIDPKELRIGNWISWPQTADIARRGYYIGQVSGISEKTQTVNIKDYFLGTDFKLSECKPIPLTEEWLLRLGFGKDGEAPGRLKLDCDLGVITIRPGKNVEYVHQLQNIYFALAGLELTIKTPVEV